MSEGGRSILERFRNRWQVLLYAECLVYAVGAGSFLVLVSGQLLFGFLAALLTAVLLLLGRKPWTRDLQRAAFYVDTQIPEAGYSSSLLLASEESLPGLSRLQRHRVAKELRKPVGRLRPPNKLLMALAIATALLLLGLAGRQLGLFDSPVFPAGEGQQNPIQFTPLDSLPSETALPELLEQRILLDYPNYTGLPNDQTAEPNIRAVQGTRVKWSLRFGGAVAEVILERGQRQMPLRFTGDTFDIWQDLNASGFYNFRFRDSLGRWQVSDIYSLQAVEDQAPEVQLEGIGEYTYFESGQAGSLDLQASISDDYGLEDVYIVATVSKGSGESVKFREERLSFEEGMRPGVRTARLGKNLDLSLLKMDAGDELYFYVEAQDRKQPTPNRGRSQTYFAVIRDTSSAGFAVEGTLGADLMPDYFRSQRQLIIDTEKLIAEAATLSESEFKSRSNELGFDQKALRIKYGQFMGEENEMEMAPEEKPEESTEADEDTHDHDEDPLEAYTHDHDGDNAHNLVAGEAEEAEDPLHEYIHNHSDPEAATLFEESLRTKLRRALDIMWDAELQLRLYQPKKSLPYQYRTLKLLQEIKNSARIYVHRIGFDPPPIKEDKRLTGDIEAIDNAVSNQMTQYEGTFPSMREMAARLETLIEDPEDFGEQDAILSSRAGEELAFKALEEPGRYLSLLQDIKATETKAGRTPARLQKLRKGLFRVLPKAELMPSKPLGNQNRMNLLYLQELGSNE
jgi:hypothetical protein